MAKKAEAEKGLVQRGVVFGNEAWVELKKVHPPTKQETIQATLVVMMMLVLFSVFLGLADYLVGNVMRATLT